MKISYLLVMSVLLDGCSTMSMEEHERVQYRRIDNINQFLDFEELCKANGGIVHVTTWGVGPPRNGLPEPGDYYWCEHRYSLVSAKPPLRHRSRTRLN